MGEAGHWYLDLSFADGIAREAAGSAPIERGAEGASAARVLGEEAQANSVKDVVAAIELPAETFDRAQPQPLPSWDVDPFYLPPLRPFPNILLGSSAAEVEPDTPRDTDSAPWRAQQAVATSSSNAARARGTRGGRSRNKSGYKFWSEAEVSILLQNTTWEGPNDYVSVAALLGTNRTLGVVRAQFINYKNKFYHPPATRTYGPAPVKPLIGPAESPDRTAWTKAEDDELLRLCLQNRTSRDTIDWNQVHMLLGSARSKQAIQAREALLMTGNSNPPARRSHINQPRGSSSASPVVAFTSIGVSAAEPNLLPLPPRSRSIPYAAHDGAQPTDELPTASSATSSAFQANSPEHQNRRASPSVPAPDDAPPISYLHLWITPRPTTDACLGCKKPIKPEKRVVTEEGEAQAGKKPKFG